jgi:hypothetical protein
LPLGAGAVITNYGSGSGTRSCPGSLILSQIFEEILNFEKKVMAAEECENI